MESQNQTPRPQQAQPRVRTRTAPPQTSSMAKPAHGAPALASGRAGQQDGPESKDKEASVGKKATAILAAMAAAAVGAFLLFASPNGDNLSDREIQQRDAVFSQAVAAGQLRLPAYDLSDPQQVAAAKASIEAMPIASEQKQAMVQQVQAEAQKAPASRTSDFLVLELYDNADVDGDVVAVQAPGFPSTTINLTHSVDRIVIPKQAGVPLTVRIVGVRDGGGGLTLGVNTASGPLPIPVIGEGNIVPLTVP